MGVHVLFTLSAQTKTKFGCDLSILAGQSFC